MKNQNENSMLKNSEYRRLQNEKRKLIKRISFAEQRIEKYGFTLSDKDLQLLQQRIDNSLNQLADINDRLSDLEESGNTPTHKGCQGFVSQELIDASREAAR